MFYSQCNNCNERWELGTASTCKCLDEEPVKFTFKEINDSTEVLRVTLKGEFIWHPDADNLIAEGDFSQSPALPHILRALRKQRTWVGLTPACPQGLTEYACEVEGVDLVCFLEHTPSENVGRDSYGLPSEPGTSENLELVNAYVKGTDVDIGHLLLQYLVDHITTTALEDLKNDDF